MSLVLYLVSYLGEEKISAKGLGQSNRSMPDLSSRPLSLTSKNAKADARSRFHHCPHAELPWPVTLPAYSIPSNPDVPVKSQSKLSLSDDLMHVCYAGGGRGRRSNWIRGMEPLLVLLASRNEREDIPSIKLLASRQSSKCLLHDVGQCPPPLRFPYAAH